MKMRKSNLKDATTNSSCCSPTKSVVEESDPCCVQPTDGSSCCDKTESKEVNSELLGCC